MAAEVQHTLSNLEITPPPGAWNAIAARLDTEFDADESALSDKLAEFELAPPSAAWQNIEAAIVHDPAQVEAAPAIIITRPFRRWAAAAAAVVVLALGSWYIMNRDTPPANTFTVVPVPSGNKNNTAPRNNDAPANKEPAAVAESTRPLPRRPVAIVAAAQKLPVQPDSTNNLPDLHPELLANLQPTGMQNVQSFSSHASPNVAAPPIRDANGDIILDKDLIFASDNNYIVVTGPNGEQTRISSKFLPLISSLNDKSESLDYFQFFLNEDNIWKLRFNEWRDKMIRQASLIPTATNLLDIIQLKEILQEN
jgi:hypothetical protein